MPISLTRLTLVPHRKLDRGLSDLAVEAKKLGVWKDLEQRGLLCLAEAQDLGGVSSVALLLHGGFPLEIVPPWVLSQDLSPVAQGLIEFSSHPIDIGCAAIASLREDAGGRARVLPILSELEEWAERAEA